MEEVDYKKIRQVMWSEQLYRLRELPDCYGYPLIIRVIKGTSDLEGKQPVSKGEILRIDGEQSQRRIIATDGKGRHWSFPVHIGAKFDVPSKKEKRQSMYMSEIVQHDKLPKKFTFAKRDDMQINITGEDPATARPLIEGDFKTKEVTKLRMFKANRIMDNEIDPRVMFLPAYMDMEVAIATKFACEPEASWDDYVEAITNDISKKVNLNMYRGKADIQIYEFNEKMKKTKQKSTSLYEEHAPAKIVTIGGIIKQRTPSTKLSKSMDEGDGKRMSRNSSLSSIGSNSKLTTFEPEENEEPARAVTDILTDLQDKDESEMTEEELRIAKHRRMMLAFLARDDGEEEENIENDEKEKKNMENDGSPICEETDKDDSVSVDHSTTQRRIPPRVPTRRTPVRPTPRVRQLPENLPAVTDAPVSPKKKTPNPTPPVPKPRVRRMPESSLTPPVVASAEDTSYAPPQYSSISDFPADVKGLTIDAMCRALNLLRLEMYEEKFREQKIDGEMAKELTEEMITYDLGMNGLEAKKFFKFIHHNWRPV